jgi:hypothetical protein
MGPRVILMRHVSLCGATATPPRVGHYAMFVVTLPARNQRSIPSSQRTAASIVTAPAVILVDQGRCLR